MNPIPPDDGKKMNIKTTQTNQPTPQRGWDWVAYIDGQEEDGLHGLGRTEAEAIKELEELMDVERI